MAKYFEKRRVLSCLIQAQYNKTSTDMNRVLHNGA